MNLRGLEFEISPRHGLEHTKQAVLAGCCVGSGVWPVERMDKVAEEDEVGRVESFDAVALLRWVFMSERVKK